MIELLLLFILLILFLQFPLLNVLGYEPSALIAIFLFFRIGRWGIEAGQAVVREVAYWLSSARLEKGMSISVMSPTLIAYDYLRRHLSVGLIYWMLPLLVYGIHSTWVSHCNFLPGMKIYSFITLPALLHGLFLGFFLGVLGPNQKRASEFLKGYFLATAIISFLEGILGPRVIPHNLILGIADVSWAEGRDSLTGLVPSYYWHRAISVLLSFLYFLLAILLLLQRIQRSLGSTLENVKGSIAAERFYITRLIAAGGCLLVVAGFFSEKTGLSIGSGPIRRHLSQVEETDHFMIYVEPGSPAARNIHRLVEEHEWYYYQIQQLLGRNIEKKISSYVYSSEDQKQRLTGLTTWFANPFTQSIHVAYNRDGLGLTLKHEIVHIFEGQIEKSWRFWIFPPLVEGLAEMIEDDYWRGEAFHEDLAAAHRAGVLAPVTEVMTFRGFGLGSTSLYKSYDIAGSFCGFLSYRYGTDQLLSLFRTFDYKKSFGKSLPELGQEWIKFLETVPVRPEAVQRIRYEFDDALFPPFHREPCPRLGKKDSFIEKMVQAERLLEIGHFSQARALFVDLIQQGDPSGRFRLREIESLRRQGEYDEAIRLIEALYALAPSSVETLNEVLEVRTRLYLQAGQFDKAEEALDDWDALEYNIWKSKQRIALYRAILRHKQVRSRLIQGIEASDPCSLSSQNQYRQALKEDPSATSAHYLLVWCALENPEVPIDETTQLHAQKFLEEESELNFAKAKLLQILGRRAFQTGYLDQALRYFEQLPQYEDHPTVLYEVERWQKRIAWNRQRRE